MSAWKDDEEEVPPSKIALKNGKCGFVDLWVVCENRMLRALLNGCGVWNFFYFTLHVFILVLFKVK